MSTTTEKFDDEELIPQCIEVIKSEGKASVSLLQRRLTLGYSRAARLMKELESRGYVGPDTGIGLRDILIDLDGNESKAEKGLDGLKAAEPAGQPPALLGATHNDRAISMTKSARKAACKEAGTHWELACQAKEAIDGKRIELLNELRETGRSINVACGREQLLFTVDGSIFCREQLLPHLPLSMSIEAVQGCVHIANKLEEPVTTVEQLLMWEKQLQPEFQLLGLAPSPRQRELQKAHTRDFFNHFVSAFTSAKTKMGDLEKPEDEGGMGPMEQWSRTMLEGFLENTVPIEEEMQEKIKRAQKLALGKG